MSILHWDWRGETLFPGDSANPVTIAEDSDSRLEMFRVGSKNDFDQTWQVDRIGKWTDLDSAGGAVATSFLPGSGTNCVLMSDCDLLTDVDSKRSVNHV